DSSSGRLLWPSTAPSHGIYPVATAKLRRSFALTSSPGAPGETRRHHMTRLLGLAFLVAYSVSTCGSSSITPGAAGKVSVSVRGNGLLIGKAILRGASESGLRVQAGRGVYGNGTDTFYVTNLPNSAHFVLYRFTPASPIIT